MRLISWNVANRVKKQPHQMAAVLARKPDLLALQEVTARTAGMWRDDLQSSGYDHIVTSFDVCPNPDVMLGGRSRGILVASRFSIDVLAQEGLEMPWPERLVSVLVHHPEAKFELHAAYIPPGSSHEWLKIDTFEGIYHYLARYSERPRILCGDFNSPKQELPDGRTIMWGERLGRDGRIEPVGEPRWPRGERLVIRDLAEYDLVDVYRLLHGYQKEDYSWIVRRMGKVVSRRRFDHVFVSQILNPTSCLYLHEFRLKGLSDHSAIEVVFAPG